MTPREIVHELDKHIVGQADAKRAVAIALRNRWRRMQVSDELRNEISPKNILMIGPTGVGKTEIARRLAKLANAPFIKIEATKFTEVGYVGRDVESIIRDLVDISMKMTREQEFKKVENRAEEAAEDRVLDVLLPKARNDFADANRDNNADDSSDNSSNNFSDNSSNNKQGANTRQIFRKKLREGDLDDKEIEIAVNPPQVGIEIMAPPGMEEMTNQLQGMFQNMSPKNIKQRTMKIKDALKVLAEEEAEKLINIDDLKNKAIETVEQNGIVFLDELDKIAKRSGSSHGGEVSREGVQRDLLPLVEGSTVNTKYGMVKSDHILFIAAGAFHLTKPSDLIPELQGRMPIRVELKALTSDDFVRILTEPDASLSKQYIALMETEKCQLSFTDDAIKRIADAAFQVNETTENIGARRLHTVMERLLESISFNGYEEGGAIVIDESYVNSQLNELIEDEDLSRYIL